MEQIEIEPHHMEGGYVKTVKLIRFTDTRPADTELLEINPIPFKELGNISEALKKYYTTKTHAAELKKQYESFRDECRRTHAEVQTILKQPTMAETAERHRQEMEEALKKPQEKVILILPDETVHEPKKEALQEGEGELILREPGLKIIPEPQEPPTITRERQQAVSIYDKVIRELSGKKVENEDIMAAVMRAGVHPNDIQQVTGELIELMKEKGAIDTPRGKLSRLFGGGKKKETGKK